METGVEQPIDWAIAPNMHLNNLRHICNLDAAIPHLVGQHPYRGPQVALALAFTTLHRSLVPRHHVNKGRQ
jgi:uracil DNA glycosylase